MHRVPAPCCQCPHGSYISISWPEPLVKIQSPKESLDTDSEYSLCTDASEAEAVSSNKPLLSMKRGLVQAWKRGTCAIRKASDPRRSFVPEGFAVSFVQNH